MKSAPPIRTSWTDRSGAPETSDAELSRRHLIDVHRTHPGFTESCASKATDAIGRSSYDWLAEVLDPGATTSVLDLGCGSGVLLELCRERLHPNARLTGVDMSTDELALASARLEGGEVDLLCQVAQDLSFAPAASFDAVLSHWAMTLMDPVEPVLVEVARILKGGGVFSAIVDGDPALAPGYDEIDQVVSRFVHAEGPRLRGRELGDPRMREAAALTALVRSIFPSADIRADQSVFSLSGEAGAVAREAVEFFYAAFVLVEDTRERLIEEVAQIIERVSAGAVPTFHLPACRLFVRAGA